MAPYEPRRVQARAVTSGRFSARKYEMREQEVRRNAEPALMSALDSYAIDDDAAVLGFVLRDHHGLVLGVIVEDCVDQRSGRPDHPSDIHRSQFLRVRQYESPAEMAMCAFGKQCEFLIVQLSNCRAPFKVRHCDSVTDRLPSLPSRIWTIFPNEIHHVAGALSICAEKRSLRMYGFKRAN